MVAIGCGVPCCVSLYGNVSVAIHLNGFDNSEHICSLRIVISFVKWPDFAISELLYLCSSKFKVTCACHCLVFALRKVETDMSVLLFI